MLRAWLRTRTAVLTETDRRSAHTAHIKRGEPCFDHASAEIVGFNPQPDPPGRYTATFEVYSLVTGYTSILLGGPDTLPPPGIVP